MNKSPSSDGIISPLVGPLLQAFFADHLYSQKRASPRTVQSYRDTFRLLLQFLRDTTGKEPVALVMQDIDAPTVLRFLDYVEGERRNQVQSRNVRLAAIRSFFRMAALRDPMTVGIATRVLAIPVKRADKWPKTAQLLRDWFKELESDRRNEAVAFPNARGKALSRHGVDYLLQECVERAVVKCPSLADKNVFPHLIRHSTAMHLLQSGVDITVIALWLGHESIQTTHGYVAADLTTKEQMLAKMSAAGKTPTASRLTIRF